MISIALSLVLLGSSSSPFQSREQSSSDDELKGAQTAAFSLDGRTLGLGGYGVIAFYDYPSGKRLASASLFGGGVDSIAFDRRGSAFAVAGESVYRLDAPGYRPRRVQKLNGFGPHELLDNCKSIVSRRLWALTVIDIQTGRSRALPGEWMVSRTWERRRAVVVASRRRAAVVDVRTLKTVGSVTLPIPERDQITVLAASPDRDVVYVGTGLRTLYRWTLGGKLDFLGPVQGRLSELAVGSQGRYIVGGGGPAMVFDAESGRFARRVSIQRPLLPYVFSPDGRAFLARQPNGADLWDVTTGHRIRTFSFKKP